MGIYLVAAAVVVAIIIIFVIIAVAVKSIRAKIVEKLKAFHKKMIYNGLIGSFTLGFLSFACSILVQGLEMIRCPKKATVGMVMSTVGMVIPIIAFMIISTLYMIKHKENLQEDEYIAKIGSLYSGIRPLN